MKTQNHGHDIDITDAVAIARNCEGLFERLAAIYDQLAQVTAAIACKACGACCDFETFGHRLYLSTIELAYLLEISVTPGDFQQTPSGKCPWHRDNLCTARAGRALGCRVFNCRVDPDSENAVYEQFHQQIIQLHEEFNVPYLYMYLPNAARSVMGR